jgi:predicted phosphodiesterase
MELKILLVSDSHDHFDNLNQIVSENDNFDFIFHSGDFANIPSEFG